MIRLEILLQVFSSLSPYILWFFRDQLHVDTYKYVCLATASLLNSTIFERFHGEMLTKA